MKKLLFFGLFSVMLSGCIGDGTDAVTPPSKASTPLPTPIVSSATQTPDAQSMMDIRYAWEQGSHARVEGGAECDACHQSQNGIVQSDIAWWNRVMSRYESVDDNSDLCRKCHEDYDHAQFAHKNLTCLDCHDEHNTSASCFDCHKQIMEMSLQVPATPVDGHNTGMDTLCNGSGCHSLATQVATMPFFVHGTQHIGVTCAACHDADGLEVGPQDNGSTWVPWRSSKIDGEATSIPFSSHNLQYQVDCSRCHYEDNPWDLHSMGGGQSED